jgi:hypothetical protein
MTPVSIPTTTHRVKHPPRENAENWTLSVVGSVQREHRVPWRLGREPWEVRVVARVRGFEGMVPAAGVDHARWVVDALVGGRGVAAVVPGGFEACARILHPLPDGERWRDVAPSFLAAGDEPYEYPYAEPLFAVEGDLGPAAVDALATVLAPSTGGGRGHFGLWDGWGWLHPGAAVVLSSARDEAQQRHDRAMLPVHTFAGTCPVADDIGGGRSMLLLDGPLESVGSIGYDPFGDGSFTRRSPQWWWPPDRTWFVATEIDFPWTYLAGPEPLVDAAVAALPTESTRITTTARW